MDAKANLTRIQKILNSVFETTIDQSPSPDRSNYYSTCLSELADHISDQHEVKIITIACSQIQSSSISATFGLYRQAFASLRLALEMGLSACYFSAHRLELNEWLSGRADIRWARLIDEESGVLSVRFAKAFFAELSDEMINKNEEAANVYRKLSEFVHGNSETWEYDGSSLKYNPALYQQYQHWCKQVFEVITFTLCCRHLKEFNSSALDSLSFIGEEFSHIAGIRQILGGPKDI